MKQLSIYLGALTALLLVAGLSLLSQWHVPLVAAMPLAALTGTAERPSPPTSVPPTSVPPTSAPPTQTSGPAPSPSVAPPPSPSVEPNPPTPVPQRPTRRPNDDDDDDPTPTPVPQQPQASPTVPGPRLQTTPAPPTPAPATPAPATPAPVTAAPATPVAATPAQPSRLPTTSTTDGGMLGLLLIVSLVVGAVGVALRRRS